tara:strand:+ start:179 stop:376 length:198 start_codon:yes stop_codon:yes gene_type:complete
LTKHAAALVQRNAEATTLSEIAVQTPGTTRSVRAVPAHSWFDDEAVPEYNSIIAPECVATVLKEL